MTAVVRDGVASPPAARPRRLGLDEAVMLPALMRLPVSWISPGENARDGDFGDLTELAMSLFEGQELPVVVEQLGDREYRLLDGERRWRAAVRARASHLDALLRRPMSDRDRILRQLRIQTHHRGFNAMAEAKALHKLRFEYGMSRDEIASLVGHGQAWVRDRLALMALPAPARDAVARGDLPITTALKAAQVRRAARRGGQPKPPSTPRPVEHFGEAHPLADLARQMCVTAGHTDQRILGGVACGRCWEDAIRADEREE
jgi:ParB/RepB/Spo0J family partition protein